MIKAIGRRKGANRQNWVTLVLRLTDDQMREFQVFDKEEFNITIERAQTVMFEEGSHGAE